MKDPDAGKSQKVSTDWRCMLDEQFGGDASVLQRVIFWALVRCELQHCSTVLHGVFG